ncbi:UNVERIFIED_CONTAM: hypothetical protein H355_003276 [Colinus virginianus]|nr:hypothetical protein H355_003276 [Colinus virginianus]
MTACTYTRQLRSTDPRRVLRLRQLSAAYSQQRREREEQQKKQQQEDELKKREVEEARRDDLTVLVLNLCLKAEERHIYEFFSANAGKIRDIQLIRDQRSGTSKGVAYVEFYTQESVIKAMALNGIAFKGQPLRVQASMAEKNRAARAAKQQQQQGAAGAAGVDQSATVSIPMRVYVGGLVGEAAKLGEDDLKALFSPFGRITQVDIPQDENTGCSRGYGFLLFASAADAHEAMQHMNNFELLGAKLRVGYAADGVRGVVGAEHNTLQQQQAAAAVLQHTQQQTQQQVAVPLQISQEAVLAQQLAAQAAAAKQGAAAAASSSSAAQLLAGQQQLGMDKEKEKEEEDDAGVDDDDGDKGLIHGRDLKQALMQKLLNRETANASSNSNATTTPHPADVDLERDPDFFLDIQEDVKEECEKFGEVQRVWIDQKNVDGKVWVKFSDADKARAAFAALHGRYFAGKPIAAEFVSDAQWDSTTNSSNRTGGSGDKS